LGVAIVIDPELRSETRQLLKYAFVFVHQDWQHAKRDESPDQGFERQFRALLATQQRGWKISENREMHLGLGLGTGSGVLHEIDLVARGDGATAVFELKNKGGAPADKNDAIVFFAKVLDYVSGNPELCTQELTLALLSSFLHDSNGIAACLGLGIYPIAPELRPLPLLQQNAKAMEEELSKGLELPHEVNELFTEFRAELNMFTLALRDVWPSGRWGYHSDRSIFIRSPAPVELDNVAARLVRLNAWCGDLLRTFKELTGIRR